MKNRGFTLIELMVGMTVALLVIGVVTATFLSQQRAIQALDLSRDASNAGRDAMLSMQEAIGRAGYGIDPRLAFDFKYYNCPAQPCRDKINGPDEMVFVERDPNYYWSNSAATTVQGCDPTAPCAGHAWRVVSFVTASNTITIETHGGENFVKGQLIEVTCANGQNPLIGEVSSYVSGTGTITLTVDATNPYKQMLPGGSCYGNSGTSLFLVNRYHYHVVTISGDPWLMLDRGIDFNQNGTTPENGNDLADEIPISHGLEGLQIAYLLQPPPNPWTGSGAAPTAPDNGTDWVIGDSKGVQEEPSTTAAAPSQGASAVDPLRYNMSPANIRGVRLRLTARSILKDLTQPTGWAGDPYYPRCSGGTNCTAGYLTTVENADSLGTPTGSFRRYFSSVSVATPNLNSKDPFIF